MALMCQLHSYKSFHSSQYMMNQRPGGAHDYTLVPLEEASTVSSASLLGQVAEAGHVPLSNTYLSMALNQKIESPNRVIANRDSYITLAVGMPELVGIRTYNVKFYTIYLILQHQATCRPQFHKGVCLSKGVVFWSENLYCQFQSSIDVHLVAREPSNKDSEYLRDSFSQMATGSRTKLRSRPSVTYLPKTGQIIRAVPAELVPKDSHPQSRS